MGQITDIVLTTRNRLPLLKRSLARIYKYTTSPYSLHVIDDASTEGNAELLIEEWQAGRVHHLLLRSERCGIIANSNAGAWMALSDPVVFTDDDVLCPQGTPDWLSIGLEAMHTHSNLGILALNHPGARRGSYEDDGVVTYCNYVGGTFMFIRRKFLGQYTLIHRRGDFGHVTTQARCQQARKRGWRIGYLTNVYCKHIGAVSANGSKYGGKDVPIIDEETLEPMP